jgi:tetratricopeptide (TPR) repeat protein
MTGRFKFGKDPKASSEDTPAFGSVAERVRRGGDPSRAVELCREGLKKFPGQLSARVTLGWALLDLGLFDDAREELEHVLERAPDNLAAIRGLAELHERSEGEVTFSLEGDSEWPEELAGLEGAGVEPAVGEGDPVAAGVDPGPEPASAGVPAIEDAAPGDAESGDVDPDLPPAGPEGHSAGASPEVELGSDDTPGLEAALDELVETSDHESDERLDEALARAGLLDAVTAAGSGDDQEPPAPQGSGAAGAPESPIAALERFLQGAKARRDKAPDSAT